MTAWILSILSAVVIALILWLSKRCFSMFQARTEDHKLMRQLPHIFKEHKKEHQDIKGVLVLLQDANLSQIRDRLVESATRSFERNCMTINERETWYGLYSSYKALGGNSFIDSLKEQIDALPIKE